MLQRNAVEDKKRRSQSPNRAAVSLQSRQDAQPSSVSCDLGDVTASGEVSKEPSLPKKVPIPPSTKPNIENKSIELPYFPPAENSKYSFVNNTNNKIMYNPLQTQAMHMQIYQQQQQVQQQQMQQHYYHPNPYNVWPPQQHLYQPQRQLLPQPHQNFVPYPQFSHPHQFYPIGAGYAQPQMYSGYPLYQNQQHFFLRQNPPNQVRVSNSYQNQIVNQSSNLNKQNIVEVKNNVEIKKSENENKLSEISNVTLVNVELDTNNIGKESNEVISDLDLVENEPEDMIDRIVEVGSDIQELQSEDVESTTEEGSLTEIAVKSTVTEEDVPKPPSFASNYIIHDTTRQELKTLLKENPNGIWAADLLEKFKVRIRFPYIYIFFSPLKVHETFI